MTDTLSYNTASILTPTQYSRQFLFDNLINMVNSQTCEQIIEWVIVEGSPEKSDAELNKMYILQNTHKCRFPVKYIEYSGESFSGLFNLGNSNCSGDCIVVMEDDDFYPSTRVSHALETLKQNNCLLVGCSGIYCYDYFEHAYYKFKPCRLYDSSANNSFGYHKSYLNDNKFANNYNLPHPVYQKFTIEESFTKNWTNPVVQLDPKLTILYSIHSQNTIDKTKFKPSWKICNQIELLNSFPLGENEYPAFEKMREIMNTWLATKLET